MVVDYYIIYNVELREPRVSYRHVARQFRIGKPDLQEGVEARRHGGDDEDSNMQKKRIGGVRGKKRGR